jgi:hypothetical protein
MKIRRQHAKSDQSQDRARENRTGIRRPELDQRREKHERCKKVSDPARENEKLGNRGGKTKAESEKTNAALTAAAIKTGREKPGMRKSTEDQNRQERRSVETRSNPTQLLAEESATSARADRTTKKVSTARAGETIDQI